MDQSTDPIERAMTEIARAIADLMQQISAAAGRKELNAVMPLTKKASELEAINNRLRSLRIGSQVSGATPQIPGTKREIPVRVTQGMINQNLLTLTDAIKRGVIRVGEKFNIEVLPSGDRIQTELLATGNKLQERSKIAKFYRDAGLQAGDIVVLSEVTPGHWQLKKRI